MRKNLLFVLIDAQPNNSIICLAIIVFAKGSFRQFRSLVIRNKAIISITLLCIVISNASAQSNNDSVGSRWSKQIVVTPNSSYREVLLRKNYPDKDMEQFERQLKQMLDATQVPAFAMNAGFDFTYSCNKHLDIRTGIEISNKVLLVQKQPGCLLGPCSTPQGSSSRSTLEYISYRIGYNYLTLPLQLRLKVYKGQYTYGLLGGVNGELLLFEHSKLIDYYDSAQIKYVHNDFLIGDYFQERIFNYSLTGGLFVEHQLKNKYTLGIEPVFNWSGRLIIGEGAPVFHFFYIGLTLSIGKPIQ
jgi:hypothetical protein